MEEEEGGIRLSKRFLDQGGEVAYNSKSSTAWSHNFVNQKPWHPLSYSNQRRKWIAKQQYASTSAVSKRSPVRVQYQIENENVACGIMMINEPHQQELYLSDRVTMFGS